MTGSCPHRDDAGPWVLDALAEEDARAFAAHLETCDECRAEVAALQPVADVLPMAAPQAVPPPELKDRIMAVVESEAALLRAAGPGADRPAAAPRRRHRLGWLGRLRPVPAAVLATALLALGVVGGVLVSGGSDGVTTHPGFGPKGTQVALRVDGDHGQLDLHGMPEAPAGRVYQVWLVTGKDKPRATQTLFMVPADGRARVDIPDSLKDTDQVLVTAEPPGGSTQPTSSPVAGAKLS
ncbi:MAG TPA: anti-sigma factor [Baekduia sp.]|nr:anti-sigma factor [Baekduia sp.]